MKSLFLTIAACLACFGLRSQVLDPVKWTYDAEKVAPNKYDLHFKAKIEKGWHIYSQNLPEAEIRPIPTSFKFAKNGAVKFEGQVNEKGHREDVYDPNFEMKLTYYSDQVIFTQRVTLLKPVSKIAGSLEFMCCDDEKCLPPDEREFSFDVKYEKVDEQPAPDKIEEPVKEEGNNASPFTPSSDAKADARTGVKKPVKWNYEAKKKISDEVYELRFTAKIEEGWHIYGVDMSKQKGPTPTSVEFEPNKAVQLVGKFQSAAAPELKFDSTFGFDILIHEKEVTFIQQVKLLKSVEEIKGTLVYMTCDDERCIMQEDEFSIPMSDKNHAVIENGESTTLSYVFGQGFIFGFLALLTPCVFPMIPLTVSFFLKKGGNKVKGILTALLYGLSIIVIYVGLGYFISKLFGPEALNEMSTNVYFNLAFFIIFGIFAFSFLGAFEITLPSSWANKADAKSDKGGLIGIFFMALTLAIVSFSCTGPFIGTLLVESARSAGYTGPVTGMLGFSVALAIPFSLFAIFPTWMHNLPKSGGWLNSVKVTMGFIELALALKFLSTVDMAYHWDFLKREYFLVLWIIIFALLGFYLLGKLRFSHDSDLPHISVPRLLFAIFSFAFAAYMVPGLFGAPLKLLSGLAPPQHYSEGWSLGGSEAGGPVTEGKKYADILHCPLGLDCFFDYEQGLEQARKTGKPLMLDFTGHGCVNCRKMENNVWSNPSVLKKLKNDYILVSLYVDDRTSLPENEVFYSEALGKKVKTVGNKWSHFQITRFNNNAQPYYFLLDHKEQLLTDPVAYTDIETYEKFLNTGLEEFQKRK